VTNHSVQIGSIISGPTLPEAVEVLSVTPYGTSLKIVGRGLRTGRTYDPVLNASQHAQLTISADTEPIDGDARLCSLSQTIRPLATTVSDVALQEQLLNTLRKTLQKYSIINPFPKLDSSAPYFKQ